MESTGENAIIDSEDAEISASNMQPRMIHFILNPFRSETCECIMSRFVWWVSLNCVTDVYTHKIFIHLFVLNYQPEVLTAEGMK